MSLSETSFVVRRLSYSFAAMFGVITIVFILLHMSGDPLALLVPRDATQEDVQRIRHAYDLDQPVAYQYGSFIGRLLRGDLGYSYRYRLPVTDLVIERVGATIQLALAGLAVAALLGVAPGIVAATHRGSLVDGMSMLLALLGMSLPSFWLGLVLIVLFGVLLGWLPVSGYGGFQHLVMPAFVLGSFYAAQISRITRTSFLEVLAEDYIRTAQAKGLTHTVVLLKHALRNAALPIVTLLGLSFGRMLSGTIIVEWIFAWPGIGRLAVQAVLGRDFPVVQGVAILAAGIFLTISLGMDVICDWVDPRLRLPSA
jgi:glutathione transport system permease protein